MGVPRNAQHAPDRIDAVNHALASGTQRAALDAWQRDFLQSLYRRVAVGLALTPDQLIKLGEIEDAVLGPEQRDTTTRDLFL